MKKQRSKTQDGGRRFSDGEIDVPRSLVTQRSLSGTNSPAKPTADPTSKTPKESTISINRSDGLAHDLQSVLSGLSASLGFALSSKGAPAAETSISNKSSSADSVDSATINITRSDGLSHDIIQVFKANSESDAKGDTLKLKSRQPSLAKIQTDPTYYPKSIRIVHMSDTHNFLIASKSSKRREFLPDGDILVHSGDFTNGGSDEEYAIFNQWLGAVASNKFHYRIGKRCSLPFSDGS